MKASPSGARVAPHAWHAFGGIWRLTAGRFVAPMPLLLAGVLLAVFGGLTFLFFEHASPKAYLQWAVDFYLLFLVPVIAFLTGAGAMREELKPEAIDYVVTRPIRRPALVGFKFLAHVACMQLAGLLALAVMAGLGLYREIPAVASHLPWLLLAQGCAITAFAALGFLAAILTSKYVVVGLLYAAIIEIALGRIPTQLNRLSMLHQLRTLLTPVTAPPPPGLPEGFFEALLALGGFTLVALAATAAVFSQRELIGTRDSES